MKGWGWGGEAPKQEQAKEWYNAQSTEDYEAYLKWCEENKQRQEEQKHQQELLDMFKAREAKRKEEMEKERMEDEKEEREKSMMAQWKNWEKQLSYVHEFDELAYEIAEEKMEMYHMVLNSFLKFCKCNDYSEQITAFFSKDGMVKCTSGSATSTSSSACSKPDVSSITHGPLGCLPSYPRRVTSPRTTDRRRRLSIHG